MFATENKIKFVYSDEARKMLPDFLESSKKMLENEVKENKYVFGDDIVEITAADVKRAIESTDDLRSRNRYKYISNPNYDLLLPFVALFGLIILMAGVFFDSIREIFSSDPIRIVLITYGLLVITVATYLRILIRQRNKREEFLQNYYDYERRLQDMSKSFKFDE